MSAREARGVHSEHPAIHAVARIIVILVALGAAVLSFDALTELAQAAGIHPGLAWIWAVVIDGFILVATLAAFALDRRSRTVKAYAWLCLAVFTIFSILGNGWHAAIIASPDEHPLPIWVAVTVTAIPPVALFLAIHLLFIMLSPTDKQKDEWRKEEAAEKARLKEEEAAKKAAERAEKQNQARKPVTASQARPSTPQKPVQAVTASPASTTRPVASEPSQELTAPQPSSGETVTPPTPITRPVAANEPGVQEDGMTREQLTAHFDDLLARGEPLPGPSAAARLLNRSNTSGARFVAKYKETRGLAE